MTHALVLTYHAIERGEGPLHVDASLFEAHVDTLLDAGATFVTASELIDRLGREALSSRLVALTFDDGIASIARVAAPLLAARGVPATVFCVAGHLGGASDWPSAHPGARRLELARADELAGLAQAGWEIGCHGMVHSPLVSDSSAFLERELVDAKALLERDLGTHVRSYAYPYGARPSPSARTAVERTYDSAWTTALELVTTGADIHALPRVDAHYVRRPWLLRAAFEGSLGSYLRARRLGATARRTLRADFVKVAP
jgi:peptidoglycan/xylan/chitin deacetylase (PgdA/CDA1 family)